MSVLSAQEYEDFQLSIIRYEPLVLYPSDGATPEKDGKKYVWDEPTNSWKEQS